MGFLTNRYKAIRCSELFLLIHRMTGSGHHGATRFKLMAVAKFRLLCLTLIMPVLPALLACAQESASADFNRFQDIIDEQVEAGMPGVTAYVRVGDDVWTGTAGLASIETGKAMTTDTAIRMASITKIFTLAVLYQMIEEGHFTRDTVLEDLLPKAVLEGLPNTDRITIGQLMDHRAGLVNFTGLDSYSEFRWRTPENRARMIDPLELIDLVRGLPAGFEPGTQEEYCNTCYFLLGLIIEEIDARPLHASYRARIFDPYGFRHVYMEGYEVPRGPVAGSYATIFPPGLEMGLVTEDMKFLREGDLKVVNMAAEAPDTYNSWAYSAGALNGTARDGGHLVNLAMSGDLTVWTDEQADSLLDPDGTAIFGWSGGSHGIAADLVGIPTADITIAMFYNGNVGNWDRNAAMDLMIAAATRKSD